MEIELKNKDIPTKAKIITELVFQAVGTMSEQSLLYLMSALNRYHHKRLKRPLTDKEMAVYDCLLRHNISPYTGYSWILAMRCPEELRRRHAEGRISLRRMVSLSKNYLGKERCMNSIEWMKEAKELISEVLKCQEQE